MIRYLPFFIDVMLLVYCLIDCVQTDERLIRNLPRWAWIALIVIVPLFGGIGWLIAGRPAARDRAIAEGWDPDAALHPRPLGPDDDAEFLAKLRKDTLEHEKLLDMWEDDLRRREQRLRSEPPADDAGERPA